MDNITFQKIKDIILKNADIAIIVAKNPNFDQMAAGLGLYLVLKQMGKNVSIVCPTNPTVSVSSLVGIDQVKKNISGEGGDLTVSFPYKEGEIEKVSYTLDNGQLNIVVKTGEKGLSFQQQDVQFRRGGKMPTLLFFIGVSHLNDVSEVYSPLPSVNQSIVNFDNSLENDKYGQIVVVDAKWSSVSEQIADFVTLLEPQIELDSDTAQNLLDGIYFATNNFKDEKTSYLAFEVAGILMKKGAKREKSQKSIDIVKSEKIGENPNSSVFFPPNVMQNQSSLKPLSPRQNMPIQTQSFQQPIATKDQTSQPVVQAPVSQPITSTWQKQQVSNPSAQTPPDWLTPKVYKGSSII